ncbi:Uncharacterised protein [Chlamydia trachomatis]|nr:Uncharacterised protein [Chlamydia trachomatis]
MEAEYRSARSHEEPSDQGSSGAGHLRPSQDQCVLGSRSGRYPSVVATERCSPCMPGQHSTGQSPLQFQPVKPFPAGQRGWIRYPLRRSRDAYPQRRTPNRDLHRRGSCQGREQRHERGDSSHAGQVPP